MNVYDIESLKNRINLMENELEMLKRWVDLLIKENANIVIVDNTSTKKYYDDTVTHNYDDPVYIITE